VVRERAAGLVDTGLLEAARPVMASDPTGGVRAWGSDIIWRHARL
jgi:hypothetical protein